MICYKYNKPTRNIIFNFNKFVSDLDIHANTLILESANNLNLFTRQPVMSCRTGFLRCIGYLSFIKDRIKLDSLQTLALAQLQNFQNYLTSGLTAIKTKVIKYCNTMYERSGKKICFGL